MTSTFDRMGNRVSVPSTTVNVPLEPSPGMRDILSGQCGQAYRAIRRWHPGLPEDPHPVVQQALEDAFMEAYRMMMAANLEVQNGRAYR